MSIISNPNAYAGVAKVHDDRFIDKAIAKRDRALAEAGKETSGNEVPDMTLNRYQDLAMTTCMPTCRNVSYMLLNLQGEVGELSSKLAKLIRKGRLVINGNHCEWQVPDSDTAIADGIEGELGDILWQLSGLCDVLGYDLDDVAKANLAKLASRKKRGVIDGNGDNR